MKRRLEKKPPLTEAAFEAMIEQQDDVSTKGFWEGLGSWAWGVFESCFWGVFGLAQLQCMYSAVGVHVTADMVRKGYSTSFQQSNG